MDKDKEYVVNVDSCGRVFFYKGNIQLEDDFFITFWDKKIGSIRLNKKNIISIKLLSGDSQ